MTRTRALLERKAVWAWAPGMPIRNFIWAQATLNAIAQPLIRQQSVHALAEVTIVLDRKTLAPETRELFRFAARQLPVGVNEVLMNLPRLSQTLRVRIRDRFALAPTRVRVQWSDECDATKVESGLTIAHHFARHFRRHLLGLDKGEFKKALLAEGFEKTWMDFTPVMMRPMSRAFVRHWRAVTGLPEPML